VGLSNEESKIIQHASLAVGTAVSLTAKRVGEMHGDERGLDRAAACRAGCSSMISGLLAPATLVGTDKDGAVCSNGKPPASFINEHAKVYVALLMVRMASSLVERGQEHAIEVEFSAEVLTEALNQTEKLLGPADGRLDPKLIECAREYTQSGESGLALLNRMLESRSAE
jgi:hypothetical protein